MKKKSFIIVLFALIGIIFSSCSDRKKVVVEEDEKTKIQKTIGINKYLVTKDKEVIQNYIKRRGWKMNQTKKGLWYMIHHKGNGKTVKFGNIVSLKYRLSLLDGTFCYNSDSLGLKIFKVGQGGVEQGLEKGILLLHKGDKARFILPPFLAHGLLGDMKCIPARSTILYEIEVVDIK